MTIFSVYYDKYPRRCKLENQRSVIRLLVAKGAKPIKTL